MPVRRTVYERMAEAPPAFTTTAKDEAEKVYGSGTIPQLLKKRKKYLEEHRHEIPESVEWELPSLDPKSWEKEIRVYMSPPGTTITSGGYALGGAVQRNLTGPSGAPHIFLSGSYGKESLGHETSHVLQELVSPQEKKERAKSSGLSVGQILKGVGTLGKAAWTAAKERDWKAFSGEAAELFQEGKDRYRRGFRPSVPSRWGMEKPEAVAVKPAETPARLTDAVRLFHVREGRPVGSQEDVMRALDYAIEGAQTETEARIFKRIKKLPYSGHLGQMVVKRERPKRTRGLV